MTVLTFFSGLFGVVCIVVALITGSVGFAILNENEELVGALVIGVVALLLFGAGLHFLHLLPW